MFTRIGAFLGLRGNAPLPPAAALQAWEYYARLADAQEGKTPPVLADLELVHARAHHAGGLEVRLAYAQADTLIESGRLVTVAPHVHASAPEEKKLNKFTAKPEGRELPAYRPQARSLWLEERFAGAVSEAAARLAKQGLTLLALDGLRTMEAGWTMAAANPEAVHARLLSPPGKSAHNKGLAFDGMVLCADDALLDTGGYFDHLDPAPNRMETAHRNYRGPKITARQYENRLVMERALVGAALSKGFFVAGLREEFWDFRPPGGRKDLWRVAESVARCIGAEEAVAHCAAQIAAGTDFADYDAFRAEWARLFAGKEALLDRHLGAHLPPDEKTVIFHNDYSLLSDAGLPPEQRLANAGLFDALRQQFNAISAI